MLLNRLFYVDSNYFHNFIILESILPIFVYLCFPIYIVKLPQFETKENNTSNTVKAA